MNEILMQVVIDMMHFLTIDDESIVDPDRALSELERIAGMLQDLPEAERDIFLAYVAKQINEYSLDPMNRKYVDFLKIIRSDIFHMD